MSCEILHDGGFETTAVGDLPPIFRPRFNWYWYSISGNPPHVVEDRSKAHGGSRFLRFEIPSDISSSIYVVAKQNLTTSPGTDYRLRYWVKTSGSFVYGDFFQVDWNDNVINHSKLNGGTLQSMSSLPYQVFEFVVTASDLTSILTFEAFISRAASIYLDDVSVCLSVVRNGNFETGNFLPWTLSSSSFIVAETPDTADTAPAHGGTHFANMHNTSMEQFLFTIPGAKYELSYWIRKVTGYDNDESFEAQWNDNTISRLNRSNPERTVGQYQRFRFEVTAESSVNTPSLLKFIFNIPQGGYPFLIDDVALTLIRLPECIPRYLSCEIINDGGFESTDLGPLPSSSPSGWYSSSKPRPVVDNQIDNVRNGARCLRFERSLDLPNSVVNANQNLSTLPGFDYRLRYWIKTSGSSNVYNFFQVKWNNNPVIHSQLDGNTLQNMTSYREFEFVVTVSSSPTILSFEANLSTNGSIYLDDVSVKLSVVHNGNFETRNFFPWILTGNGSVGTENSSSLLPAHDGFYFAFFNDNTSSLEQFLPTSIGATYELSYWIHKINGYFPNDYFEAQWNNTTVKGSRLDYSNSNSSETVNRYKRYSFDVTANSEHSLLKFVFNVPTKFPFLLDTVAVTLKALPPSIICYSGNSLVLTKNILTQEIKEIPAKKVLSNKHLVYSVTDKKFIPVKYNIVTGPTTEYYLIKKHLLDENEPFEDLYVTPGHIILYKGNYTKAKNIPGATKVQVEPEKVYSICTNKKKTILVNGLPLLTWGFNDWVEHTN
ncbi:MAG: hypothetical protein QW303_07720, partial [Nitrososphaerota archaeon]